MLNMKKGLAIVLAAATALTFAPVSTLGLTSVVEAQAAAADTVTATVADKDSKTTVSLDKNEVAVDTTNATKTVDITLNGLTASSTIITFTFTGVTSADATTATPVTANAASETFTFTVPQGTTPQTYTVGVVVDKDGGTATLSESDSKTITIRNTASTFVNAGKAEFKNVDSTIYMRDVVDTSVEIKPTYIVTTDGTSVDGSQLYYQLTTNAPTGMILNQSDYKATADGTPFSDLKVEAKKGSIKITRKSPLSTTSFYLGAYKLSSDSTDFELVGYKEITLSKYNNAAYKLKLAKDYYTLSLNTIEKSDDITSNIKVSDVQGTYLDDVTAFTTKANWSVSGDNIATAADEDAYKTAKAAGTYGNNTYAVYITDEAKFIANAAGKTTVTVTATNGSNKIAQTTITLEVLGTSKYDLKATVDGSSTAGLVGDSTANPIVLNTKTLSTYDLAKHMYKNNDAMVLSYESNNAKNTVNETTGVVTATTAVDSFKVTVSGKINGATIAQCNVYFKVNALPYDTVNVTGEDKDSASTLSKIDYEAVISNANVSIVPTEQQLAASQIKYVQIEVTGSETKNVTESLNIVSTGGAVVTASLAKQSGDNIFSDVTNNGVITLNTANTGKASGVAAIKLISAATANNVLTESYIFVVVDKKDADITAPSAFKIGTETGASYSSSIAAPSSTGDPTAWYQSAIDFDKEFKGVTRVQALDETDDLLSTKTLYPDAKNINKSFVQDENASSRVISDGTVYVANTEGKTEKLLLTYNTGNGDTYQIVSVTSVPGVNDAVEKIEDASTGKVIYTSDMGTQIPQIVLDGVTTLKVTITYPIDKNSTDVNISSSNMYTDPGAGLNQTIMTATKEMVTKGDTFNTFYLYPTIKGTQVVKFKPQGNISVTDRSIVKNKAAQLACTYRTNSTPEKVTGLKVKNKKGAKVTVTFDAATNHNMKYWVQKKIGKKVSGKSVASNKTTLSVKKGATVKVRVKAYYYDNEGNKHVGKYSSWKTLKTDKK